MRLYCAGLLTVLKRYRFNTLLGWGVVLLGCLSVPLGWRYSGTHSLLEFGLSGCTVVAGLALVQQSIASLSSFLQIPLHSMSPENPLPDAPPVAEELRQLLHEIEEGGWQEAYAAIEKLEEIEKLLP